MGEAPETSEVKEKCTHGTGFSVDTRRNNLENLGIDGRINYN